MEMSSTGNTSRVFRLERAAQTGAVGRGGHVVKVGSLF